VLESRPSKKFPNLQFFQLLRVSKEFLGRFNMILCNSLCLELSLKMKTLFHPTRMMGNNYQQSFLGWDNQLLICSLILIFNLPWGNDEENLDNNDDARWDAWPIH
jgi:hypothetical protein